MQFLQLLQKFILYKYTVTGKNIKLAVRIMGIAACYFAEKRQLPVIQIYLIA